MGWCQGILTQKDSFNWAKGDFFICVPTSDLKKKLPNIVSEHSSNIIKKGKGIDITLQENKGVNIGIASSKINGIDKFFRVKLDLETFKYKPDSVTMIGAGQILDDPTVIDKIVGEQRLEEVQNIVVIWTIFHKNK